MPPVKNKTNYSPYLSALGAWALAFGCAVGWGAFAMPGNTFLPLAGPGGTALAILIGADNEALGKLKAAGVYYPAFLFAAGKVSSGLDGLGGVIKVKYGNNVAFSHHMLISYMKIHINSHSL